MKKIAKHIISHPLFSGSVIVVIGTNLNNVIQYFYHPIMGRLLGISLYGEMVAAFSLIILFSIIPSSLNLVIVKYVSSAKSDLEASQFFSWVLKKSIQIGLVLLSTLCIFSGPIASFLNISTSSVVLSALAVFLVMPVGVMRSLLQGKTDFNRLVISVIIESLAKVGFGSLLVLLGLSVQGAILGLVCASIISQIYLWIHSKPFYTPDRTFHPHLSQIAGYTFSVVVNSLASASLFSTDVLLVKHFLSPTQAGIYASLSALGKIVLYASGPIASVSFPVISTRHGQHQPYFKVLVAGLVLTSAICAGLLFVYKVFPTLTVHTLFGSRFDPAVPYLFIFGFSISLFSLASYLSNFLLSINIPRVAAYPALAALLQAAGIIFFHSDIWHIIKVSIFTGSFLLLCIVAETVIHFRKYYAWAK